MRQYLTDEDVNDNRRRLEASGIDRRLKYVAERKVSNKNAVVVGFVMSMVDLLFAGAAVRIVETYGPTPDAIAFAIGVAVTPELVHVGASAVQELITKKKVSTAPGPIKFAIYAAKVLRQYQRDVKSR